ncbi:THUMP domain-containing protein [Staphylococcus shinii]|uniref:THUMP domain-containing protein n=1 Tax=Staphylococcus shinii TaxID=2912228 RepID=UPI003EBF9984
MYDLYLKPFLRKGSFYVNVSRSGSHNYTRFEVANKTIEGIKKRYPHRKIGTSKNHDIEFRLDIIDDNALFSIRLTDATYRFRQKQRSFNKAALLPTVAHAMV